MYIPLAFSKYQYMANLSAHRSSPPNCDIVRLVCSKCQTCQQSTSRECRCLHLEQTETINTTQSPPHLWRKQSLSNIALLPSSESPPVQATIFTGGWLLEIFLNHSWFVEFISGHGKWKSFLLGLDVSNCLCIEVQHAKMWWVTMLDD